MKLAAVGDNCIDKYINTNELFPGGNPVNVAVYFSRLNGNSSYIGVIGNDKYGNFLKNSLKKENVNITHLKQLKGKTAVTEVKLINGERILGDYNEGVFTKFELKKEDLNFILGHDLVHSGFWGKTDKYLQYFHNNGLDISFDFANKLENNILEKIIKYIKYAFFSYQKDDDFIRSYMKKIHLKGANYVIVTLGENGSILYNGYDFLKYGIIKTNVVDTMGAGDAFIAGFLKAKMEEKTDLEAMELGTKNAAKNISHKGAW
ncbi:MULTISPECIES: fructoselysine 6-kinase [unclassified Halanaerobium]|uniref:fructoselysine 6-kinase n=1 Tax=unclassified Halanaerobium TaxID=2641197 RepID=UPI000DF2D24D|nr:MULTISPECIES: fructoselysine 6-kinase [unclassified Halanaerobium]RCW41552.1 fructoselysine 6-kinase [Halanaerobium sp. MA284_MarDTE_T2]RCW81126.1 fructoselysine 6-kinase [Halanaerobium sp. DL-01]